MRHTVNWFELFVHDFDRAVSFYERLLQVELKKEIFMDLQNAIFPGGPDDVRGALVKHPARKPGGEGTLVYLNATGVLDAVLGRVAGLGGTVLTPKTDIGEPGFIALIRDLEGNVVGLHSPR